MFMNAHMSVCMCNLGDFLCCCDFIPKLLHAGSSSERKAEREIMDFELMKRMRCQKINGRSHRSINKKCQNYT